MISLKQSIFLALELRQNYLENVEPEARASKMGRRYARYLLDSIIDADESTLEFDAVQRDLGWVMSLLVERRDAAADNLDALVDAAKAYNLRVEGAISSQADPSTLLATDDPTV